MVLMLATPRPTSPHYPAIDLSCLFSGAKEIWRRSRRCKKQARSNGVQEMRRGVCGGASLSMVLRGLFAHLYLSCFARAEVKPRMVD